MTRRTALTAATAVSLAAVTGTVGIALNLGILRSGSAGAGDLKLAAQQAPSTTTTARNARVAQTAAPAVSATAPATEYVTYYQDVPAPATPPAAAPAPAVAPAQPTADPVPTRGGIGTPGGETEDGSQPPATTEPSTTEPTPPTTAPRVSTVSYEVGGAGTVTAEISASSMRVLGTTPANGWSATVSQGTGQEVSVVFTGPGGRLIWKAHLEDSGVQVEIETEG